MALSRPWDFGVFVRTAMALVTVSVALPAIGSAQDVPAAHRRSARRRCTADDRRPRGRRRLVGRGALLDIHAAGTKRRQPGDGADRGQVSAQCAESLHRRRELRHGARQDRRQPEPPRRQPQRDRLDPDSPRHVQRRPERLRLWHQSVRDRVRRSGDGRRPGGRLGRRTPGRSRIGELADRGVQPELGCRLGSARRDDGRAAGKRSSRFRSRPSATTRARSASGAST